MEFSNFIKRLEDNELTELLNMSDYELTAFVKQQINEEIQKRSNINNEKLKYDNKFFVIYFGDLKKFTNINFSLKRCYFDKNLDEYIINNLEITWSCDPDYFTFNKNDKLWSFELLKNQLTKHDFLFKREVNGDIFDELWKKYADENIPISTIKNRIINEIKMYEEH